MNRELAILGTRGVPAAHGGFETFCERFALHLVARGWRPTVYCQLQAKGGGQNLIIMEDEWRGVRRVMIPVRSEGAVGTMVFDARATMHAAQRRTPCLVLGYNTAVFAALLKLRGIKVLMNMDGIEWKRAKWSPPARAWLFLNELAGSVLSDHLIADHPRIADHLARRRRRRDITMIPYGGDSVGPVSASPLDELGVCPDEYFVAIGRIEPENSVLELVKAFSSRQRGLKLLVLGKFTPQTSEYHAEIAAAASAEVIFPGPIYEKERVDAIRKYARAYCHGHTVGGTNPSLVEALGAGNAVIAHDNPFNRWVAGEDQFYFADLEECVHVFDVVSGAPAHMVTAARRAARRRHSEQFQWPAVLQAYEQLVVDCCESKGGRRPPESLAPAPPRPAAR